MPAISAYAPGKTILVGEHAVVYSQPAIAIPVHQIKARVSVQADVLGKPGQVIFHAPDIKLHSTSENLDARHPFNIALNVIKRQINSDHIPACSVNIKSTVPIASGLGSSAAISVALIKALGSFTGLTLNKQQIADLAYEVEIQYHGTPSGIDNTVIAFEQPILFKKGEGFRIINPSNNFSFILADSGISGNTKQAVSLVRTSMEKDPEKFKELFEKIGSFVYEAENYMITSDYLNLGKILTSNHHLLQLLGVSHPKLDKLVMTATDSGAYGAKLCGGGLGGNIVALVNENEVNRISEKLIQAGATRTISINLIEGRI
jgi:mevalonate kinase